MMFVITLSYLCPPESTTLPCPSDMQYTANSNLVQNNDNPSKLSIRTMPDPEAFTQQHLAPPTSPTHLFTSLKFVMEMETS